MGNKGGTFEREVSYALSDWWTHGARDDVFWRSNASGARATVRKARTHGQHGDITATHPDGTPLIDCCVIEAKRGYSSKTIADLFDVLPANKVSKWEEWLYKAHRDHQKAGSFSWLLITRRDRRRAMVCMPHALHAALLQTKHPDTLTSRGTAPGIVYMGQVAVRQPNGPTLDMRVVGMHFDRFLFYYHPKQFIEVARAN